MAVKPGKVWVPWPAADAGGLTLAETLPDEIEAGQGVLNKKVRLSTDGNPLKLARIKLK